MAPRETENNAYAKFCGDKERALWYVRAFSGVVNRGLSVGSSSLLLSSFNFWFSIPLRSSWN